MSHKSPPPPPLFAQTQPPSHRNAPTGTSTVAAEAIRGQAAHLRALVLAEITRRGEAGATDEEVQAALGMQGNTQRPRRGELVAAGLVVDSGRRRPTRSGKPAAVWVAAEFARAAQAKGAA